jgi:hypothetical protein
VSIGGLEVEYVQEFRRPFDRQVARLRALPQNTLMPTLLKSVQAGAKALNIGILLTHASTENDIEQA